VGSPHDAVDGVAGTPVVRAGELQPGQSRKFTLACGGREIECFVVNWRGLLRAYVNQCRHVPMTMDWVENQFFDEAGEYLLCPTHGALYEPEGGECVMGPPCGKTLFAVPLVERDGVVRALCPDPLPD
jgi:nitrite reductase/ring-hydroxylating ferredoxin subunit